ncbi:MAG: putative metal-binding motif-containing protein, partial [Chitinophagales bacterium]|nr:putative metal-binding motif-containing protein [Chitinophagales bacterium]
MKRILFLAGIMLFGNVTFSQTVTSLVGAYKNGQVFLTWTNVSNSTSLYKVYRSTTKITSSSQLATSEYLGQTNYHSSKDFNLSNVDGTTRYLHIDAGAAALNSSTGLFVATTLVNSNYYYAVTTSTGGIENTTITTGVNSLSNSIVETVLKPQPVLQETRTINGFSIEIYTMFQSSKYASNQPLLLNVAGFFTHDFALNRTTNSVSNPLLITNHGGGSTFLDDVAISNDGQAKLNIEDWFPDSTISSGYWGSNPAYDIYNSDNNVAPTTGVNVNYTHLLYSGVIDWAINNVVFDTNRISLSATSTGSPGAFFYAITYPTRIAAVKLSVGAYNLGFLNDYNPDCSLNTGKKNRKDGDKRLGKVETNLDCSLGIKTYDALNGGKVINDNPDREYPFIYSINGKLDKQVGWTEKTIWYDSVNNNHFGGWFFWDSRDHNGDNGTWDTDNFDVFKYYKNRSFPAISNCSLNEDFGNGDGNTGSAYGTLNGAVDWVNEITETTTSWTAKLFVRDLIKRNGLIEVYPDSCTADVTPRRRQQFKPVAGSTINYTVSHKGSTVQTGSVLYQGNALVIPGLKIYKDTSVINLTISGSLTFFLDADKDGYGNPAISIQAATQPTGYVLNNSDCNDANAAVNPAASDICNGIDDNCNGIADENAVTVSISSNGATAVCAPATISLTSVITGTVTSYQWLLSNVSISGASNNTY